MSARLTLASLVIIASALLISNSCQKEKVKILATVTTDSITNITTNSATSGGTISNDGGAQVTARGVCWSTSPNPTIDLAMKTSDGTGTGDFQSSITGLTEGTTYFARVYATNSVGTNYGETFSFKTLGCQLTKITTSIVQGNQITSTRIEYFGYNGDQNLAKYTTYYSNSYNDLHKVNYTYTNNLVSSFVDLATAEMGTWSYDSNQRLVVITTPPQQGFSTSYHWADGQLQSSVYRDIWDHDFRYSAKYKSDLSIDSITYSDFEPNFSSYTVSTFLNYDGKKNPQMLLSKALNLSIFPDLYGPSIYVESPFILKNNPISQSDHYSGYYFGYLSYDRTNTINYAYEYNIRDFPTKIIATRSDGVVTTKILEYTNCDN